MNKWIVGAVVVLTAAPVFAGQARERQRGARAEASGAAATDLVKASGYATPRADGSLSCSCNVVNRIVSGLTALQKASQAGALPEAQAQKLEATRSEVSAQLSRAESYVKEARGKGWAQQEDLCGRGASGLSGAWSQWQPFLAQNGLDSDFYTGVKAKNPDIPDEGDEAKNGQGRFCNSGQWWTEDRAYFAINGREGVCTQSRYEIRQLLNAAEGERGSRCFEYKLK